MAARVMTPLAVAPRSLSHQIPDTQYLYKLHGKDFTSSHSVTL